MKMKKTKSAGLFIVGTLIGGAVGATAGILLAPRSGKLTRSLIAEKANEVASDVKKNFKKK